MALKRAPDGHYIIECTARDIDPASLLDWDDVFDSREYCPVCGENYDVLGRCVWRKFPDHQIKEAEYKHATR